jgi:iron complex transport system substrate-binding protein
MTENIFALGAAQDLVGVTTFCDYPEEAKKIYKIGDFSNPSLERIVGLKPDLVIVNLPEQTRIKKELEKLDINIFISSPQTLDDIYNEIIAIGRIVKKQQAADSLVNYMKMHISRVDKPVRPAVEGSSKKRVYIELSPRPLVTIGAPSFLNELLEMAGAENIFADLGKDYPVVPQEEVIKRNPDVIIVLHPEDIRDRLGWRTITAISNNEVYTTLNQDHLMRPGPRLIIGFEQLKRIMDE